MANIVFVLAPSMGSLNSSLKLAKMLKANGHQVSYVGLADSEEYVLKNGVEFKKIYEKWFPKGFGAKQALLPVTASSENDVLRAGVSREQAFLEAILNEDTEFPRVIETLRPDLILHIHADPLMVVLALQSYALGINAAYLRDMLGRSKHSEIPPIWTGIIPSESIYSRLCIQLAWHKNSVLRTYSTLYSRFLASVDFNGMIKKLAKKSGYPWALVDKEGLPPYILKLPEVVLCPKEFDFPHSDKPGRYYTEASIDIERNEVSFAWDALDETRPLVYCALGTLAWLPTEHYRAFYQAVIDAACSCPGFQWILAVGDFIYPQDFTNIPSNAIIVHRAPQLQMLKRSRMMITHGGTNTIKECIYFGVPMVVFPLGYDHPGNAARVIYHGLGVKGDFLKVTKEQVRALVDTINLDSGYVRRVQLMQSKFQEAENAQLSLKMIEALLQKRSLS
ncbi:nucleotide disphospho-sugar-binding domain-containing protein [Nitrosomonas sp.]|uniref:nucleotide disphospho-sugar-binding domain-containing protein n=1 Tax=Nitrosomonas sp. TaxID=42353 RepID=UPI0033064836